MARTMTTASFCAMTCAERPFQVFFGEHFEGMWPPCETKEHAAEIVTTYCGITSRIELNTNPEAAALWKALKVDYEVWKRT